MNVNGIEGLSTGQLSNIIGVKVSAQFLIDAGNQPLMQTHIGYYWKKDDAPKILESVINQLQKKLAELRGEDGYLD